MASRNADVPPADTSGSGALTNPRTPTNHAENVLPAGLGLRRADETPAVLRLWRTEETSAGPRLRRAEESRRADKILPAGLRLRRRKPQPASVSGAPTNPGAPTKLWPALASGALRNSDRPRDQARRGTLAR